jgi:hypothetical protein
MKNLSGRLIALVAVGLLALLGLVVLSVAQARYELLLVALLGGVGIGLALAIHQKQVAQSGQLRRVVAKLDQVAQLAQGIPRLEDTVTGSPRMLEGSQERQLAETAARFDWLARRHLDIAEQLDTFLQQLEATVATQHQDVLAQLQSQQGTAGSPS